MDSQELKSFDFPKKWIRLAFQTKVPILYYHRVNENISPKLGVSPKVFESQMKYLRRMNYRSVAFEDLENHILFGQSLPPHPVIISFDDGYADFFTRAYPILKRFGFTATVFLVSDYIGKRSEWEGVKKCEISSLLTRENIYRLMADGFHFGSHGLSHKKLTSLLGEEARTEVEKSKEDLENLLQRPVRSFSYPYGDFNAQVVEIVERAGFSAARTVRSGNIHFKEDLIQLRCIKINGLTPKAKFIYYLSRLYHLEQIWQERRKYKEESIKRSFIWQAERETNIL
jgi:peptidoglycan/xylan/chitin deacetylase (PgdA/CDA1 family)